VQKNFEKNRRDARDAAEFARIPRASWTSAEVLRLQLRQSQRATRASVSRR
jgi:hypothetical protein